MNIIILGANQVGSALAENLVSEKNDVTVVDNNTEALEKLAEHLDIRTINGHPSYPTVLRKAGADDADMLIAVTDSDEINIVACQVAYSVFNIPTKLARLRAHEYISRKELFSNENAPIDYFISPERLITDYISSIIDYPGALQILDFADGKVRLLAIKAHRSSSVVGKTVLEFDQHISNIDIRIVAIYRNDAAIPVNSQTKIEVNDEVFFIADRKHTAEIFSALDRTAGSNQRIIIAGGGHVGLRLAESLESRYQVKIIERDQKRAEYISEQLSNTIVLNGDGSDKRMLLDENIENTDVFCAVTNDDEDNIMSCLQAKRLGARQAMSIITRPAYVDLIEGGRIDLVISPQQITIGSILRYVRHGDVVNLYSLRRGAAEAIEIVAHGDQKSSKVVGRAIKKLKLPEGTTVGCIIRGDEVILGDDATVETGDHVLLFVSDKRHIRSIERLFQISATFF